MEVKKLSIFSCSVYFSSRLKEEYLPVTGIYVSSYSIYLENSSLSS